jgi:hypothetical protein
VPVPFDKHSGGLPEGFSRRGPKGLKGCALYTGSHAEAPTAAQPPSPSSYPSPPRQAGLIRVTDKFRDGVIMVSGAYFVTILVCVWGGGERSQSRGRSQLERVPRMQGVWQSWRGWGVKMPVRIGAAGRNGPRHPSWLRVVQATAREVARHSRKARHGTVWLTAMRLRCTPEPLPAFPAVPPLRTGRAALRSSPSQPLPPLPFLLASKGHVAAVAGGRAAAGAILQRAHRHRPRPAGSGHRVGKPCEAATGGAAAAAAMRVWWPACALESWRRDDGSGKRHAVRGWVLCHCGPVCAPPTPQLLDFDMIRSAARSRMPKWFEW